MACVISHSFVSPPQREGALHREEIVYELNPLGECGAVSSWSGSVGWATLGTAGSNFLVPE